MRDITFYRIYNIRLLCFLAKISEFEIIKDGPVVLYGNRFLDTQGHIFSFCHLKSK